MPHHLRPCRSCSRWAHGGRETQGAQCSRAFPLHQPFMSCCQEAAACLRSLLSTLTASCRQHLHKCHRHSDL